MFNSVIFKRTELPGAKYMIKKLMVQNRKAINSFLSTNFDIGFFEYNLALVLKSKATPDNPDQMSAKVSDELPTKTALRLIIRYDQKVVLVERISLIAIRRNKMPP